MTAVTADLPSRSLSVCPNTYQFPCSTLTSLIQPQSRHHCREIRSPNTRHKNGCFTDLEKQEKALVNQITCQSKHLTVNIRFLLLHWSYQCEWRCIGKRLTLRRMWRNTSPICIIFRQHDLLQLVTAQPPPLTPSSRIAGFAHAENKKFQEQELHFTGKEELLRFSRKKSHLEWALCLTVMRKQSQSNWQPVFTEHSSCVFPESCWQRTGRCPEIYHELPRCVVEPQAPVLSQCCQGVRCLGWKLQTWAGEKGNHLC